MRIKPTTPIVGSIRSLLKPSTILFLELKLPFYQLRTSQSTFVTNYKLTLCILKVSVGPRGSRAILIYVPSSVSVNSIICDTCRYPDTDTKSFIVFFFLSCKEGSVSIFICYLINLSIYLTKFLNH